MSCINFRKVAELLVKEFKDLPRTDVNPREVNLKDHILDIMKSFESPEDADIMSYMTLDMDMDGHEEGDHESLTGTPEELKDSDPSFSLDEASTSNHSSQSSDSAVNLEYKTKVVNFWRTPTKNGKKRSFTTVQKNYKKLKYAVELYRWAEHVDQKGSKYDKLAAIKSRTLSEFVAATNKGIPIHEVDIQRWAIDASVEEELTGFKASATFVKNFKEENNIGSRKITKIVSRANFKNEDGLQEKGRAFVEMVKPLVEQFGPQNVFNTDQSGMYKEMHSGRTLAVRGAKKVEKVAQSVNATTHSYTIQPLVACDGRLVGPLLIVLQEPSGEFGPRVKEGLFLPDNVLVLASKSGKCSTEIMQQWYRDVFLPNTGEESALFVDAWGGFKRMKEGAETSQKVTIEFIPEGTTRYVQPWDVFGARPWKNYVRRLSELIKSTDPTILMYERNNIIKLQSLTYRQLTSPRYSGLFQYSWYSVGYVEERAARFQNPANFGFDHLGESPCAACEDIPIVRCSWCRDNLCAVHFFVEYHNCGLFVP